MFITEIITGDKRHITSCLRLIVLFYKRISNKRKIVYVTAAVNIFPLRLSIYVVNYINILSKPGGGRWSAPGAGRGLGKSMSGGPKGSNLA